MRKTTVGLLAVLALIGLGLAACGDAPLAPEEPSFITAQAAVGSGPPVVQSVTGNGHDVGARTYTMAVFKLADGTVRGWFHVRHRGKGGAHVRVAVDCLHVVGNRAWGGGVIVAAADPGSIGDPYSFRVIDNGEGGYAPADRITTRHEYLDCATEWDSSTRELTIGNLQVRD